MQLNSVIGDRYQLLSSLKQNIAGATYKALDLHHEGSLVAVKIVSLKRAEDWKTLELFQKEVQILARLNHPQIPQYIDYFEIDTPDDRYYCLVREYIDGVPLSELINSNYLCTESNVAVIGSKLLAVLQYLHELSPAIIHRDLNPEHILRSPDGSIYLIDFGAATSAQGTVDLLSNSFVGTFGYAPPEQFRGQVVPASDLYSLGRVLLFLLRGANPVDAVAGMLSSSSQLKANISPQMLNWLHGLITSAPENRFASAQEALAALSQLKCLRQNYVWSQSLESEVREQALEQSLERAISASETTKQITRSVLLQPQGNTLWIHLPNTNHFQPQRLVIEAATFTLYMGNSLFQHPIKGNKADLSVSLVKKEYGEGSLQNVCCNICDGTNFYYFGSELDNLEQSRLVEGIKEFIGAVS